MGCGYACIGCGRCRGESRKLNITTVCFRCGHDNEPGARRCSQCGLEMPRPPQPKGPSDAKETPRAL